jgi:hypothetical protein
VTQQHTLRVACDLADLPEVIAAVERLGHRVECAAFDEWTRRRERDELLLEAVALLPGTPWGRCVALEAEIHRFEGALWPRWSHLDEPPAGSSRLRECLFRARKFGVLPSARQLRNIIAKRGGPCDFREKPVSSAPD